MQCPTCHRDNEISASAGGKPAEPGNISICWKCGGIGIVTALGVIRKPTSEELKKIMVNPDVQKTLALLAMSADPVDIVNQLGRPEKKKRKK